MKKFAKMLFLLVAATALALSFMACTGPSGPANPAGPTVDKIQIATAGKTEFTVGDDFSVGSLAVEEVKSDGTKKTLTSSEYTVDSSAYNKAKVGTYNIVIKLSADATKTVNYNVNVNPALLTNPLAALNAAFEKLGEADVQTITSREADSSGKNVYRNSITIVNEKLLFENSVERYGEIQTITITCVDGTIYFKGTQYGKEHLEKKSGTVEDFLTFINYEGSQYDPAAISEEFAEEFEEIEAENVTYNIINMVHVLEISLDWADAKISIDADGNLIELLFIDGFDEMSYVFQYVTDKTVAAPVGTYADASDKTLAQMFSVSLSPDPIPASSAHNKLMAAIDNTEDLDNIRIDFELNGFDETSQSDVENIVRYTKYNGKASLYYRTEMSIAGETYLVLQMDVAYINNTLFVETYVWLSGESQMTSEKIINISSADFWAAFNGLFGEEKIAQVISFDFVRDMMATTATASFTTSVVSDRYHELVIQSEDESQNIRITDGGYLNSINVVGSDGSFMSYTYGLNGGNVYVPNDADDYTDVTGQKTAAELFAGLTA